MMLIMPIYAEFARAQTSRTVPAEDIRELIHELKRDSRGPFQGIRWFCPDGTVLPAQSRCPAPGGRQHGLHKEAVARLAATNHVYLGQVLAGTENDAFLDEEHAFSRLKQYQFERYLIGADDGWIHRRARFYRGAYQAEDEEAWSTQFLEWILRRTDLVKGRFFMLREAVRDLPRAENDNLVRRIRAVSKEISDAYPAFLDTRIKIHGQPEAADTARVTAFLAAHRDRLSADLPAKINALYTDLKTQYASRSSERLQTLGRRLPADSETRDLIISVEGSKRAPALLPLLARITVAARHEIEASSTGRDRLRLMDASLEAEALAFRSASSWRPGSVGELMRKFKALTDLALGSGLIEWWELESVTQFADVGTLPFDRFEAAVEQAQRIVGWGIGMVTATFGEEIAQYQSFEPLAAGFLDDRMRSTPLLALGDAAGQLASEFAYRSGRENHLMGISSPTGIRGLNPGIAVGQLVVHDGAPESLDFRSDAIYILARAPADLKPVAGIATVTEGNLVSHVQLLARNLGIPNAVLTPEMLKELRRFAGQRVYYAVSPRGTVLMKPASSMDPDERRLLEQRKRSEERIRVPIDRVDLEMHELTTLTSLRAGDSGRICGPKAANLGQLTTLFPENVAAGFIIPFGVFRAHMDQKMPGRNESYWNTLRRVFTKAEESRSRGVSDTTIEETVLAELADLRKEIERMPLDDGFVQAFRRRFVEVLGEPLGKVPVFIRSDTNMEDLKDFTGAGLNLTIPNVVSENDILQGIRRVWASPYRERGYRWRQKYLLNPEDVYPSLLILKSVNVDKSGVMITTGVSTGDPSHYTVAFNQGVGGAVDGQAAEMYNLAPSSTTLISPAREPMATTLPKSGGIKKVAVTFETRILTPRDLQALREVGSRIRTVLPGTPGIETNGPFDVELGFLSDKIWLFQTRPFVENRSAAQSTYLARMDVRKGDLTPVSMEGNLKAGN